MHGAKMPSRIDPRLIPTRPNLKYEKGLWKAGINCVAGLDEAGRGALAGPVSAAAVILPQKNTLMRQLKGVTDSKQMTAKQREHWAAEVKGRVLSWGVGFASAEEIDTIGIVPATRLAMQRALQELEQPTEHLLIRCAFAAGREHAPNQFIKRGCAFPEHCLCFGIGKGCPG